MVQVITIRNLGQKESTYWMYLIFKWSILIQFLDCELTVVKDQLKKIFPPQQEVLLKESE